MPKINILDKAVAELIAAGEVVERPAAIVKELVENSIDAGAKDITIEIKGGGIRMIRVADNGSGIEREDIPRAFLRHATSKVKAADDLDSILTLGFRGEALASIAAMCKVELTTKTAEDSEGTTYRMEGGEFAGIGPAGCPAGTTITVRDIFFNTPARMKFLKSDIGEGNAIAQVIDKCALSHPEIAFRFIRDGQVKLRTSGGGELLAVINSVYGGELSGAMLPVDYMFDGGIKVSGYIAKPAAARPSRAYQNFFINGRYVRTRTCAAALEEAYKNRLMSGRFPVCVLNVGIQAQSVDVNVHPAKIEVRFVSEKPVFSAVFFAVKTALNQLEAPVAPSGRKPEQNNTINELTLHLPQEEYKQQHMTVQEFQKLFDPEAAKKSAERFKSPARLNSSAIDIFVDDGGEMNAKPVPGPQKNAPPPYCDKKVPERSAIILENDAVKPPANSTIWEESFTNGAKNAPEEPAEAGKPAEYRFIGEAFSTYIILESGDSLILADKHAAHERILYERLVEGLAYGNRQVLLAPLSLTLSKDEYGAVTENADRMTEMGFLIEDFGGGTVLVREIPIELGENDITQIVGEIAGRLLAGNRNSTPETLDRLYYSIACKAAVRSGDKNSGAELKEIIRRLEQNPQITHCPHGRPVSVKMTRRELEKMFGRLG
ncbi:DNA mismatch repair protein MutL [Clostridia bacterium]|nr:DNA mismatch repair protein MutL [Clostridia bacterium]